MNTKQTCIKRIKHAVKSKSKDRDEIQAINSYAVLVTSYSSEIISYKKNEIAKFDKKDIVHIRWSTHKSRQ